MRNTLGFALLVLFAALGGSSVTPQKQKRSIPPTTKNRSTTNHAPEISSFSVSSSNIVLCMWVPFGTCTVNPEGIIALTVIARDPDGDDLSYSYSVSAGRIDGEGTNVIWNLSDIPVGIYTAKATVRDPRGLEASRSAQVKIQECGACDGPPCPAINVSCPNDVSAGEPITFTASVGAANVTYKWTVTNGRIAEGQGSSTIEVDTSASDDAAVTATVSVGGLPAACAYTASCTSTLKKRKPLSSRP